MALKTWNGTNYDDHIGTTNILGTTTTLSPTGIFTATFTAPNTSNKCTGVWLFFSLLPSATNCVITLQESTVDKVSATMNQADINYGWNYIRFGTPYQFTTTSAGAYRFKLVNSASNAQVRLSSSLAAYTATYDSATTLGSTDDLWVGGFHNSGLTTQTLTLSGTSNQCGSGADKTMTSGTINSIGAGVTVGQGGTLKFDTTASTTLQVRGSVYITRGGLFDMRANSSDKTKVSKLIFDNETTNGDYGIISAAGNYGGQFLTTGASYDIYTTYASGTGTAADPLIVSIAWDADVGDEVVIGGGTDYSKHEVRYIKTRNSSTSFVLSTTPGGAEAALVNTHAAGAHICNMQRNSIVTALTTTRGYWLYNAVTLAPIPAQDISYTRFEYSSGASGDGIQALLGTATVNNTCGTDGVVIYQNSTGNRNALLYQANNATQTINGLIVYNAQATNGAGSAAIALATCSNKTFTNCFMFNGAASTSGGVLLSLITNSTNNVFTNCHMYGGNSNNTAANSAMYINSSGNTFNSCSINGSRVQGLILAASTSNTFNNCSFGTQGSNTADINILTSTLNTAVFNACTFGSASLITNYLNGLTGSDVAFQDMDGSTSKHRWYTNTGSFWSSGSGLTDTTVRTATSLALAIKPENNTTGGEVFFKVPANAGTQVTISGYLYRNATFSSGTLKVDLFLPGTLLTSTPDDTQTLATTTGSWLPYNLNAYYSASVSRYAIVRVTAITATAGAYAFMDDLYDAGTSNKVAGLDVWDAGHISPIMVANDFSVVASTVWNYPDTNTQSGTMGQRQVDGADNAELAAIT